MCAEDRSDRGRGHRGRCLIGLLATALTFASAAVAAVSETVEGRILRRHPSIPLEAARMSTSRMAFDDTRARHELGYSSRPAREALEESARWFVASGSVRTRRRERICWSSGH